VTPASRKGAGVTVVYGHQLTTWNLSKYSNGTVFDNQMWSANFGSPEWSARERVRTPP
jgi:hypothetical protein